MKFLQPADWKPAKGYSNGVLASDRSIHVAGQIGWNGEHELVSDDFAEQCEQALRNIVEVLAEAGAGPSDIVRLNWYVTSRREYLAAQRALGQAYLRVIGRHFPAMTLLEVSGLLEDGAKVEIEATAVLPE